MPVGTLASVIGISSKQLTSTGSEMILSNTFHLHLQPGEKLVKESGGIHKFMNWHKPIPVSYTHLTLPTSDLV